MHSFLQLVREQLQRGLSLAVFVVSVGLVALIVCGIIYVWYRKKMKAPVAIHWGKLCLSLLFLGYLTVLIYGTLIRYTVGEISGVNWQWFRSWKEAWNEASPQKWLNIILNIALFMPLGCFLPILWKQLRTWYGALGVGLGTSVIIELIQYFSGRGILDVDDLFTNTLGCVAGFGIGMFLIRVFSKGKKYRKQAALYLCFPGILILAFVGLYAGYTLQEYGNLSETPSFRVQTKNVVWELEYTLDDTLRTAPVYQAQKLQKESCAEFASHFAEKLGLEFPDAYYYDNCTIFANHQTGDFLEVSYFDGTYTYTHSLAGEDLQDVQLEPVEVRKILTAYGIPIPEEAQFQYEGNGVHTFAVDLYDTGDAIMDGTVRCWCRGSGVVKKVENNLLSLTNYREEPILTQAEAYEQLRKGNFTNGDYFTSLSPQKITVESCFLDYKTDSKGFYQPVYQFQGYTGSGESIQMCVPARK